MNSPDWEGDTAGRRSLLPTSTLGLLHQFARLNAVSGIVHTSISCYLRTKKVLKDIDGALVDAFHFLYLAPRLALIWTV